MSRTSDMTRSDLDLAGLMLRCRDDGAKAPHAHQVHGPDWRRDRDRRHHPVPPAGAAACDGRAAGKEWRFDARIVPPGVELLLPAEATDLAIGSWQSAPELAIKVSWQDRSFSGVIPIDGIAGALATMAANCPAN